MINIFQFYLADTSKNTRILSSDELVHIFLLTFTIFITGIKRETEDEKQFADFDIFDDPERPYSTFNFKYTNKAFERLSALMEFNTLLYKDLILQKVKECIKVRRRHSVRRPFKLNDIRRLSQKLKHRADEDRLAAYLRSLDLEEHPPDGDSEQRKQ